jgi:hypothetical protein
VVLFDIAGERGGGGERGGMKKTTAARWVG